MRIVLLQGGLGNQLFQYCYGCFLSKLTNESVYYYWKTMDIDPSSDEYRAPDIEYLDGNITLLSREEFRNNLAKPNVCINYYTNKLLRVLGAASYNNNRSLRALARDIVCSNHISIGYYQTPVYLDSLGSEFISSLLNPVKNKFNSEQYEFLTSRKDYVEKPDLCVVHVRGGDYITSASIRRKFHLCGRDWYIKALREMVRLGIKRFCVFSDSEQYARDLLGDLPYEISFLKPYYETNKNPAVGGVLDFLSMANCYNYIVPNSTFSWWASKLSKNRSFIVGPSKMHTNSELMNSELPLHFDIQIKCG